MDYNAMFSTLAGDAIGVGLIVLFALTVRPIYAAIILCLVVVIVCAIGSVLNLNYGHWPKSCK